MPNHPLPNRGHRAQARAILQEDRTTQVEHLSFEALRRFNPAGAGIDYAVAAKALAIALTERSAVVPTAAVVRRVLMENLGTDRAAGAIAAWMRGFMAPEG